MGQSALDPCCIRVPARAAPKGTENLYILQLLTGCWLGEPRKTPPAKAICPFCGLQTCWTMCPWSKYACVFWAQYNAVAARWPAHQCQDIFMQGTGNVQTL